MADTKKFKFLTFSSESIKHSLIDDLQAMVTGSLFFAAGIFFVKAAGLLTGGAAGLAFLFYYGFGFNFGLTYFIINAPLYWLAYKQMGHEFTVKTVICVALISVFAELIPQVISISAIEPFFAAVLGGLLMGVGLLILFRHKASAGGLAMLAAYLQERFGLSAGKVQLLIDMLILVAAFWLVSLMELVASILGAVLLNLVLAINHKPGRYSSST